MRKRLEDVKKEREEAKQQLSSLRQTQAPMLKKIQAIENQLKPIDAQIKAKVRQLGQSYWVRVAEQMWAVFLWMCWGWGHFGSRATHLNVKMELVKIIDLKRCSSYCLFSFLLSSSMFLFLIT